MLVGVEFLPPSIKVHQGVSAPVGVNSSRRITPYGNYTPMNPDHYPISIQTNGALLSEKFLDLFAETRTSVSVSIDGPQSANDIARHDHRGRSTFSSVLRGIRLLASHPEHDFLFAGTLSVIQPTVPPDTVYAFLKELNTPNMDFLLQDGNHDRLPPGKSHFSTTESRQIRSDFRHRLLAFCAWATSFCRCPCSDWAPDWPPSCCPMAIPLDVRGVYGFVRS